MNISVRQMDSSDQDAITEIYSYDSVVEHTSQLPHLKAGEIYKRLAVDNIRTLVAVIEGRVVGHVSLFLQPRFRFRHAGMIGLAVHPEHQGQGVGTRLMTAIIREADQWLDLKKLELEVHSDNVNAIRMYENLGFEIEGERRAHVFKHGKYMGVTIMSRLHEAITG